MRRLLILLLLVVAGLTTASAAGADTTSRTTFVAVLSADTVAGCDTVPTGATGVAIVTIDQDQTLSYRLIVANLDDVISAHIHFGGPGETGDIAAGLFDAGGVPVDANGVLATGTIDDQALVAALLAGEPFYVNVHTTACATGAVRGQLRLAGPR